MRRVRICVFFVLCVSVMFVSAVIAQKKTRYDPADDPRVIDAINAWSEWVEYQLAINNVPGASVGVIYDQEL
jgi:hypothetical protein